MPDKFLGNAWRKQNREKRLRKQNREKRLRKQNRKKQTLLYSSIHYFTVLKVGVLLVSVMFFEHNGPSSETLTKIPHEHVPKSHVITCDFGTCSCGIFVRGNREKRRANARNVRLHYPYWQYTNLFIFQFVSLLCLCITLYLYNVYKDSVSFYLNSIFKLCS